jgi:flagella basal body P-ring formation protein FlgA
MEAIYASTRPLILGLTMGWGNAAASVDSAIVTHVATALGVEVADVDLSWTSMDGELGCPEGAAVHVSARPGEDFVGNVEFRLTGMHEGQLCASQRVRARLDHWVQAPLVSAATPVGGRVELGEGRVLASRIDGALVEGEGPWEARANLRAGEPVTTRRVRRLPDARDGARVTLVAGGGGLVLTAPARLMDDAMVGDRVKVANLATGTVMEGTLVAADRVSATR